MTHANNPGEDDTGKLSLSGVRCFADACIHDLDRLPKCNRWGHKKVKASIGASTAGC
jgi:hypothetical protein